METRPTTDATTRLFTFGCGALGELGWDRGEDTGCQPEATAVVFPSSVWRHGPEDQADVQSVALGNDHSLAVVNGYVFRWGLLCAPVRKRCSSAGRSREADGAGGYSRSGGQVTVVETAGSCYNHSGGVFPTPAPMVRWCSNSSGIGIAGGDESGGGSQPSSEGIDGNIRSVAAGGSNSFMLTRGGEVFLFGQLRPLSSAATGDIRHLWGSSCGGPASRVMQVAAGWRHVLLLTEAGCVFALGDDEHGQCAGCSSGHVAVTLPTSQQGIAGIAAGASHCVAWDRNGAAFTWGHGGAGRLGLGGTNHQKTPAHVEALSELEVVHARCGANFTVFVTSMVRGTSQHSSPEVKIWTCGGNQYGQCACPNTQIYVPISIMFPFDDCWKSGTHGIRAVEGLECGANHVLCLARPPGLGHDRLVVWAWGSSAFGQCGRTADDDSAEPPAQIRWTPRPLFDFLAPSPYWPIGVAAGRAHSAILARMNDGPDTVDLVAAQRDQRTRQLDAHSATELSICAQEMWDALADAEQVPTVRRRSNSMPSLHAKKQQPQHQRQQDVTVPQRTAALSGKGRRLGRRLQASNLCSQKTKHDIVNEDYVISRFCDSLLSPGPQKPQPTHSISVAPPSYAAWPSSRVQPQTTPHTLTRKPSQVELLVQLGEAELYGEPQDFGITRRVDERARQTLQVRLPLETQPSVLHRTGRGQDKGMHLGTDSGTWSSQRTAWMTRSSSTPSLPSRPVGRGQVSRRVSQMTSWQKSWPPMPPSWSSEMVSPTRIFTPQDHHYGAASVPLAPNSSDEESFVPPPRRPPARLAEFSARHSEHPAVPALRSTREDRWNDVHTALEDLGSTIASTRPTQLPAPVPPAWRSTRDDRWQGVRSALDDLGSMIANIGASKQGGSSVRSQLPEGDFAAGMDRGAVCVEHLDIGQACDSRSKSFREYQRGTDMVAQDPACLPTTPSQAARVESSFPQVGSAAGTGGGHGHSPVHRWASTDTQGMRQEFSTVATCDVETQTVLSGSEAFGNAGPFQAELSPSRGSREQVGREYVSSESVEGGNRSAVGLSSFGDKCTGRQAPTAPPRCFDDHKNSSGNANQAVMAVTSSTMVGSTANDLNDTQLTRSKHDIVNNVEDSHSTLEMEPVQEHCSHLDGNQHDADRTSNSLMSPARVFASAPHPSMSMSASPSPIPHKGNDESMASHLQPFCLDDSISSSGDEHRNQVHTTARSLHGPPNGQIARAVTPSMMEESIEHETNISQLTQGKHEHAKHVTNSPSRHGTGSVSDGSSRGGGKQQDADKSAGSPTTPVSLQASAVNPSVSMSPSPSPTLQDADAGSMQSKVKPFSLDEASSSSEDEDSDQAVPPVKAFASPPKAMHQEETQSVDDSSSDGSSSHNADGGVARRSPMSSAAATPNHPSSKQRSGPRATEGNDSISEIEVESIQSFGGSSSDSD